MDDKNLKDSDENEQVSISNLLNLSVTEILILQYLVLYPSPIIRNGLLEIINSLLDESNKIHASSFYNRLERLEKNKLVYYVKNEKGKVQKIGATPLAKNALIEINVLTIFASIDMFDLLHQFVPRFINSTGIKELNSLLIVHFEESHDFFFPDSLSKYAKESYILADDSVFQRYANRDMTSKLRQTRHVGGVIREPDNFFDATVISGYQCGNEFHHHPTNKWLDEAVRVTKPNGIIVVATVEPLPDTNHFIFESIAKRIVASKVITHVDSEELIQELNNANIQSIKVFNHQGLLLVWGRKSDR